MATYLDDILADHRARRKADDRPFERVLEEARRAPRGRDFAGVLRRAGGRPAVIAEIKRHSPSKGRLVPDLVPGVLAKQYESGGASALSVLTDEVHFGGSAADLAEARSAVALPVLRKDFTVSAVDVADARVMGADAVLLIVAALDDAELRDFHSLATDLGLDVLVEAHDEAEVERALAAGALVVGVNQRDLVTFRVDTERAERVVGCIPRGVVKVAESGISGPEDASRLAAAGYDAVLVGEHLVTSSDPVRAVRELVSSCS